MRTARAPGGSPTPRGADGDASFTADGQAVVFHSQRTGHRQIFLQPITSSDAVQLTQEPADNSQPTVSPDGETNRLRVEPRRKQPYLVDVERRLEPASRHPGPAEQGDGAPLPA